VLNAGAVTAISNMAFVAGNSVSDRQLIMKIV